MESCASKLKQEDLVHTRRYFEEQVFTNEIPVIDASLPPASTSLPVQSQTSTTTSTTVSTTSTPDVVEDDNVTCRKRNLSSSSSSSATPAPKRRRRRRGNHFIDDEADVSDDEDDDDNDESESLDGFIDDGSEEDENDDIDLDDPTFYYRINNDFNASSQHSTTSHENSTNQVQIDTSAATNANISAQRKSKKSSYFKMHSRNQLPVQDYRRGDGYQPRTLDDDQKRVFNERFNLITRKGVYPYSYFTDFTKFSETSLPPKSAFYNDLNNTSISDSEYERAQNVFTSFNMEFLSDYHDLYLITDILLLADVFQVFRNMCLSYYHIDPAHCYTTPGLSWQAALRMTDVELELLDDVDMHQFIELGVRGGVSVISNRYAKADDKYCLFYVDANNLYGHAMCRSLPVGKFRWLTLQECLEFDLCRISENSSTGFILMVDLDYPEKLHDDHNDYPLAPQKFNVTSEMLSDFQSQTFTKLYNQRHQKDPTNENIPPLPTHEKLIPNLQKKTNYIVHGQNLQFYIDHGLVITKIHRVLEFQQRPWLKTYIDFNTQKRTEAVDDFEKDLFKLMNNAVFGKTLQNPRKQRNVDFVSTPAKFKRLAAHPLFKGFQVINDNLFAIERSPSSVLFDKPIYAGFTILELSKLWMYRYHYDHIKKVYPGDKSLLCFTDTDSFLYRLETKDVHADMIENKDLYDFSNFPDNHSCFQGMTSDEVLEIKNMNKKVLGKMKDEIAGGSMLDFVGLRAKMYAFLSEDSVVKKLKGIPSSIVKMWLTFEHYKQCLMEQSKTVTQIIITSPLNFKAKSLCRALMINDTFSMME